MSRWTLKPKPPDNLSCLECFSELCPLPPGQSEIELKLYILFFVWQLHSNEEQSLFLYVNPTLSFSCHVVHMCISIIH